MPTFIRFQPQQWMVHHVTSRCRKGYAFLKPTQEVNTLFLGILGRAQHKFKGRILVHNLVVMSNHYHLLLSAYSTDDLSTFMQFLNGNLTRELNRVWDEEGTMWSKRYSSHLILDECALERAYTYIFANTFKERLVDHPKDWPGFHGFQILGLDREIKGIWYDRTAFYHQSKLKKGKDLTLDDFKTEYRIEFDRPLIWNELSDEGFKSKINELMDRVFEEWSSEEEDVFLGEAGILDQNVYKRRRPKAGKRPLCRAGCLDLWKSFRDAYRVFRIEFRDANRTLGEALRMRQSIEQIRFPFGGVLPGSFRQLVPT